MGKTVIAAAVLVVVALAGAVQFLRPVAAVAGRPLPPSLPRSHASALLSTGCPAAPASAAVAVEGIGTLYRCSGPGPLPMYSTAKVMTALLVLRDHPLPPGEGGPELTVGQTDVDRTAQEAAADESVVQVAAGEQLSELQTLEALLIPSGNNIAEMLAAWDAGSVPAFVAKMNAAAGSLGLRSTHFDDPAGSSELTTSTPPDLLLLARTAMKDPVFSDVVGTTSADLPVAGTVNNVDSELGHRGVVGIKTGSAPHGTASFAGLTLKQVAGQPVAVYTAVMGLPDLAAAFAATETLASAAAAGLSAWRLQSGTPLAEYRAPWGAAVEAAADSETAIVLGWLPGPRFEYSLRQLPAAAPAGSFAGTLTITYGETAYAVRLVTTSGLAPPGRRWRLTRGP